MARCASSFPCLGGHEAEDACAAADLEHALPLDEIPVDQGSGVGGHARRVLQHGAVDREPGVRLHAANVTDCVKKKIG